MSGPQPTIRMPNGCHDAPPTAARPPAATHAAARPVAVDVPVRRDRAAAYTGSAGAVWPTGFWAAALVMSLVLPGCGPSYHLLRREGIRLMVDQSYGPARSLLMEAEAASAQRVENLYDIGFCSLMLAREKFERHNAPAAFREADRAIAYFNRVLDARPDHAAAIEGKNVALELKGQFDEALKQAEWVAEFVGPSARHQVFLAQELEERGDVDGAYLRYRQAVAMEPRNASAHAAFARFLLRQDKESAGLYHLQAAYRLNPSDRSVADELIARHALPTDAPLAGAAPDASP